VGRNNREGPRRGGKKKKEGRCRGGKETEGKMNMTINMTVQ
jgi:hypothetical protein